MPLAQTLIYGPMLAGDASLVALREVSEVIVSRDPLDPPLARALAEHDAVWVRLAHAVTAAMLEGARAKVVATATTGLDHIDLSACEARRIGVVSLRGETAFLRSIRATAEHTLTLILALLRNLPGARDHVLAGGWERDRFRGRELGARTIGIVGMGRLGTIVAELCRAFGAHPIGWDPRPDYPHDAAPRADSLLALLATSDLVTLHASYDPSTHGMIGARELAAMRPGALLVNTARGGLIDEPALLAALTSGHLAGCALDVISGEPAVSPDHPLIAHARRDPRLIITPHLGGNTFESVQRTESFIAARLAEALAARGFGP